MFEKFNKTSIEEWKEQILKDLKGKDHDILEFTDPIEELDFNAYYHTESTVEDELPGNYPYKRGFNEANNDWTILSTINVKDEQDANKLALELLMRGANGIIFNILNEKVNWKTLLNEVGLQYLFCQFNLKNEDQYQSLLAEVGEDAANHIFFTFANNSSSINANLKKKQQFTYKVDANNINLIGGNAIQEVAYAVAKGHELILQLMKDGLTIDEAAACIHFHFGIGENYFVEIAKFRAAKKLWSKVVHGYKPQHGCSHKMQITAITGWRNKSMNDPYTNLLRQTTEGLAAANGGVDHILIQPYDLLSKDGATDFARRMAINISLLLKEESYIHEVLDPAGGSYSLGVLTEQIGRKAWSLFQSIESKGGINSENALNSFFAKVDETKKIRIDQYANQTKTLIGVNKFMNPDEAEIEWSENLPSILNRDILIIENAIKVNA